MLNVADQFPTAPGVLRYIQHVPTWENGVFASWLAPGAHVDLEARGDVRAVHGISDQRSGDGTLQSMGSGSQSLAGIALQGGCTATGSKRCSARATTRSASRTASWST